MSGDGPRTFQAPRFTGTILAAVLMVAILWVFWPVRQHQFIAYDDPEYVTDNSVIRAGLTWAGVRWAFTSAHASNWHPLTWLSHMLDVELFGIDPAGPHLINVMLHAASALLLFAFLRRWTGATGRSALVAALFALHPLRVESVAWIAERKDVLSGLFFMLTLWAYGIYAHARVRSRRGHEADVFKAQRSGMESQRAPKAATWYLLALALFALGLMSKPMLVTLPCVLLLLPLWPLSAESRIQNLKSKIAPTLPFFALGALSGAVTLWAQHEGGAVRTLESFPLGERIANAFVAYARYLGNMFWPADLAVFYPHPGQWPVVVIACAVMLVVTCSVLALLASVRHAGVTAGWFWFVGMLIPVIGLVQVGGQSMADRYTYLPSIGLFIAVIWGAHALLARGRSAWRWMRPAIGAAALMLLLACAVQSRAQLRHWRDSESLFRHAIAVTENNFVAHNNLGNVLLERGEVDAAIAHFQQALAIDPRYGDARNNLGYALLVSDRPADAILELEQALTLHPRDADVHNNLGNAFARRGRRGEAIASYRTALEFQPAHARAHNNLGWLLLLDGCVDEAEQHLRQAVALQPDYANAHNNLGDLLKQRGRMEEAIAHYRHAVRADPGLVEAQHNLDAALRNAGDANGAP